MSSTKRASIGKSGIGQLMAILESRQRDMRDKDETVEKIISSVQTASSLHNAKKTSLETETTLLNSILNDIDAMNTFLKSIILIENLFNGLYQPHKKAQEEARAQYARTISKYEDKSKIKNKSNSFIELIFGGQTHVSSFQKWLDKVVKICTAQNITIKSNTGSRVKAIERTFYKAFYVYDCNNEGYKDITDLLRCSLVFDSFVDIYQCFTVIEILAEQTLGGILRVKDRFHPQMMPFGYRDLMINMLCPNSTEIVCEIQLQFAPFYQYKKVSHKMYKLARLFDVDDHNLAYGYAVQYLRPKLGSFEVYKLTKDDMDEKDESNEKAAVDMTYGELLTSWGLTQYIGKMEEEGWEDPKAWTELTDEDLKNDMGFKKGHIRKFNKAYKEWLQLAQIIQKDDNDSNERKESDEPVAIPLKIDSFHGHKADKGGYHSLHPANLLNNNDSIYASEIAAKFGKNENDWIVFGCSSVNDLYFPNEVLIQNRSYQANRVKSFTFSVGNSKTNKWIELCNGFKMENNQMLQRFKISCDSNTMDSIKKNKLNQYKLEFVDSVGVPPTNYSRFALQYFQINAVLNK